MTHRHGGCASAGARPNPPPKEELPKEETANPEKQHHLAFAKARARFGCKMPQLQQSSPSRFMCCLTAEGLRPVDSSDLSQLQALFRLWEEMDLHCEWSPRPGPGEWDATASSSWARGFDSQPTACHRPDHPDG